MIEPFHTIGKPILTAENCEEIGEKIVELFIARANSLRHAQGLSDLFVGALSSAGLPNMIRVETLSPIS